MAGMSERDNRRYDRIDSQLKVTYTILSRTNASPEEFGVTRSKDLSEGGIRLYADRPVQVPVLVQLNLEVPVRPFHLLVLGKAVRCEKKTDPDHYEIGIKFVGILPPNFKQMLNEFIPSKNGQ